MAVSSSGWMRAMGAMTGRWRFPGAAGGSCKVLELAQYVEQVRLVSDQGPVEVVLLVRSHEQTAPLIGLIRRAAACKRRRDAIDDCSRTQCLTQHPLSVY